MSIGKLTTDKHGTWKATGMEPANGELKSMLGDNKVSQCQHDTNGSIIIKINVEKM